jgi:LuxR family maltose regulon positive regulatory protein
VGVAELWSDRCDDAYDTLTRAAYETEPGTEYAVHDALGHLALLQMYEGRMHRADKDARESLAVAERAGIPPTARSGAADATLAAASLVWNQLPEARAYAAAAIATAGARQDPGTAVTMALVRAWAACAGHDGRRAIAATDTARAYLPRLHPPRLVTDRVELTALWAHLILGDPASAHGCVQRIADPAERALALGYVLEAEGDQANARDALSSVSTQNARPSALQYAALALGRLAVAEGDLPAARKALRDALDYGRPERRRRPVSDAGHWARQLLRDNADLAGEHGWLAAPPVTAAQPPPEPLTERELAVLHRLGQGLSTQDIAAALYLSVNTVKTHLKSIYRKLGTSGRSGTARRARELDLLPPYSGTGGDASSSSDEKEVR